jgi:hypothetical protein
MRIILDKTGSPVYLDAQGESIPVAEADLVMDQTDLGPMLRVMIPLTAAQVVELFEREEQDV